MKLSDEQIDAVLAQPMGRIPSVADALTLVMDADWNVRKSALLARDDDDSMTVSLRLQATVPVSAVRAHLARMLRIEKQDKGELK
jgi:hypothetical protein